MRTQHRLILSLLAVFLMTGGMMFQGSDSSLEISDLVRPVNNTGFMIEENEVLESSSLLQESRSNGYEYDPVTRPLPQFDLASRSMGGANSISTAMIADPIMVAYDATHEPIYNSVFNLQADLGFYGVDLYIMYDEFFVPDEVNVLLLGGASGLDYTPEEVDQIFNWFYSPGPHLLWIAGDSDFAGYYTPTSDNMIFEMLGSNLRMSADAVADDIFNDGASYRVVSPSPACEGEFSCTFTNEVGSAVFHGPTSVLGYSDGKIVDLNANPLPDVEVIMRASPEAYALDQDVTGTEFDHFSNNGIIGNYPLMAIENMGDDKFIIASGEATFSDYQNMYGDFSTQGIWGPHEGKRLVDNILEWWGVDRSFEVDPTVQIFGDQGFVDWGFSGTGTQEDPYIIEGFSISNIFQPLIEIYDTTAFCEIRDNYLDGLGGWAPGIQMQNARNCWIHNNYITGTGSAIEIGSSNQITITDNTIEFNQAAINFWDSRNSLVENNVITNNGWAGVSVRGNDPAYGLFYLDSGLTVTERDSIYWYAWLEFFDEEEAFYVYENFEVILLIDGEPVEVNVWNLYYDDFIGVWRFDMEYWSDPLPLGIHEFEYHFLLEGVEYESGVSTVDVSNIVPIRFWEDATIWEGQRIAWQASYHAPTLEEIEPIYAISEVLLTINGEVVVPTYSEIYFDELAGDYRWDMDYLTDPLELGEYIFDVHFFEGGIETYTDFSIVTVLSLTEGDNIDVLTNYLAYNGVGVTMDNTWGNQIANNNMEGNNQGIYLGEVSEIDIISNDLFGGGEGISAYRSSNLFIFDNVIYENYVGINLQESNSNTVENNGIYSNWGDGISMFESGNNYFGDNFITENGGAGISAFAQAETFMRFWESITAFDFQTIFWEASRTNGDFDQLSTERDSLEVILTVDGELIEVFIGDLWFVDWEGVWRYDMYANFGPLSVGEHEVETHFIVEDVEVAGALAIITVVEGSSGNSGNTFFQNYIGFNGWTGIFMTTASQTLIDTNVFEGNGDGIIIDRSNNVEIKGNFVFGNWNNGIGLYENHNFLVAENEIFENQNFGIDMGFSNEMTVDNNELYLNYIGVNLYESRNNVISNNEIYDGGAGIGLFENSNQNLLTHNIVHDMWDDGIGGWNSHENVLVHNEVYFVDDAIIFRYSNNNVIAKNYLHDLYNRGIFLTTEGFSSQVVEMRATDELTVTEDTAIFYEISFLDESFDLVMHTFENLQATLTVDGVEVGLGFSYPYEDWESGLWRFDMNYYTEELEIGDHTFVMNLVLPGEYDLVFEGIVHVVESTATSSGNVIYKNVIADTEFNAIELVNSDGNWISFNKMERNGFGAIALFESDHNWISYNSATESGLATIFLSSSTDNYISRNKLKEGYSSVYLSSSSENVITRNDFEENREAGIVLIEGSSFNYISRNDVEENPVGMSLQSSSNNFIYRNEVEENDWGIYLFESHENLISRNEIEENVAGIVLEGSHENTISRNEIEKNEYGLSLYSSNGNYVYRNYFKKNTVAIYIVDSVDNHFCRNRFRRNGENFLIV